MIPAFMGPSGLDSSLQPHFGRNKISFVQPQGNGTVLTSNGLTLTATGTATAANVATTNIHTYMRRLDYLVTVPGFNSVLDGGMQRRSLVSVERLPVWVDFTLYADGDGYRRIDCNE